MTRILSFSPLPPLLVVFLGALPGPCAAGLAGSIARIKPSIVAVGTYLPLHGPDQAIRGTAFVVAGHSAVANDHPVQEKLEAGHNETVAILIPLAGDRPEGRKATAVQRDGALEMYLLRFDGPALPRLRLGADQEVREGQAIAFTGFKILNTLVLHPKTPAGIVSAIASVTIPVRHVRALLDVAGVKG